MMRASLAVRGIAIALVALSPWLPARRRPNHERSVVYVVDRSASVGALGRSDAAEYLSDAWKHAGTTKLGVVAFDGRADVLAPLGASEPPTIADGKAPDASDVASGIRLAAALLPRTGHRSIVVLTDGNATRGDAEAEVRAAAAQGIRVDAVPIHHAPTAADTGPVVRSLKPRALHVAEGQPVAMDLEVETSDPFLLDWTRDGVRMPRRYVNATEVVDGKVELLDPTPPPGTHVYEAKAITWSKHGRFAAPDPADAAPSVIAAVGVEGKAHAVVFSGAGTVPPVLSAALAESGLEARLLPLERAADPAAFSGADLVVLADVRVSGAATDDSGLTRAAQTALVDYVQQGGGLVVTGGVFGLAPEYAGTPLARILPVEIQDRGHVEDPPVSLAIMLDSSGSMGMPVGTHTKMELAIEASLAAADSLRPTDQVAIASVDTETHWGVPLGTADKLPAAREQIRHVRAGGGGIYVFTALRDAYQALEHVTTPIRHVILFSDTGDSEEQREGEIECYDAECSARGRTAEQIAREARAHGITTTVVGIGEEEAKDTAFLRTLATAASGRFYLTAEGTDLRRIFLSETRVLAQSNLREKKTPVVAAGPHPVISGFDVAALPPLAEFVETGRRAGAENALLTADEGRPVLATWRYGLGKTAAITTDLMEGWGAWASDPRAAQLLRQTTRYVLRQQSAHHADAHVEVRDRVATVSIELPPEAPDTAAPQTIDLFAIAKGGTSRKLTTSLEPDGPGRWTAHARLDVETIVVARARDARGALMAEAVGREDRVPELTSTPVDEHVLTELARVGDGRVGPPPEATLEPTSRPGADLEPTWPFALVIASMLVVIDLVLRRVRPRQRLLALAPSLTTGG